MTQQPGSKIKTLLNCLPLRERKAFHGSLLLEQDICKANAGLHLVSILTLLGEDNIKTRKGKGKREKLQSALPNRSLLLHLCNSDIWCMLKNRAVLVNTPMAAFRGTGANHQQNNRALRLKLAMKCDMPCKGTCLCFPKCVHVSICSLLKHGASPQSWKRLSSGTSLVPNRASGWEKRKPEKDGDVS